MRTARTERLGFLHALIACYAAAAVWPAPGQWLLSLRLLPEAEFGQQQFLRVALAGSVLLASLSVGRSLRDRFSRRSVQLAAASAVAKIVLAIVMLAAIALLAPAFHGSAMLTGLLAGLAVVVAMPTAVSAVAWTSRTGNDATVALLSAITTTLATPLTVALLAILVPLAGQGAYDGIDYQFTLSVLTWCLIVPSAAGVCAGRFLVPGDARLSFVRRTNSGLILALNYCNASLLFTSILPSHGMAATVIAAMLGMAALGILVPAGRLIGWGLRAGPRQATAMRYSIAMYNTGLAVVIAAAAGRANPWIMLTPAVFTILQHVAAAGIERTTAARTAAPVFASTPICVEASPPIPYRAGYRRIPR